MKYTIYEDPVTHRFAFIPLPTHFAAGDRCPIAATDRWYGSHAEAIAALPELFDREDSEVAREPDAPAPPH